MRVGMAVDESERLVVSQAARRAGYGRTEGRDCSVASGTGFSGARTASAGQPKWNDSAGPHTRP